MMSMTRHHGIARKDVTAPQPQITPPASETPSPTPAPAQPAQPTVVTPPAPQSLLSRLFERRGGSGGTPGAPGIFGGALRPAPMIPCMPGQTDCTPPGKRVETKVIERLNFPMTPYPRDGEVKKKDVAGYFFNQEATYACEAPILGKRDLDSCDKFSKIVNQYYDGDVVCIWGKSLSKEEQAATQKIFGGIQKTGSGLGQTGAGPVAAIGEITSGAGTLAGAIQALSYAGEDASCYLYEVPINVKIEHPREVIARILQTGQTQLMGSDLSLQPPAPTTAPAPAPAQGGFMNFPMPQIPQMPGILGSRSSGTAFINKGTRARQPYNRDA